MDMPLSERVSVGIDVGGTKMLVLADAQGQRRHWKFSTGPEARPANLRRHVDQVLGELGIAQPGAIGWAVPGLIDGEGTVRDCDVLPHLVGWRPESEWPGAAVLNDGEAALVTAAADEPQDAIVAVVGCGTGIVAAVQVAGISLRRCRPYAGELGYAPCGSAGTLDQLAAGAAIVGRLGLNPPEILARLEQHDATCQQVIREAGEVFGLSLATVLQLLHPNKIAVYGGTLRYPGYWEAALEALRRVAHPAMLAGCRVERMPQAEFAVAEGALRAALAK